MELLLPPLHRRRWLSLTFLPTVALEALWFTAFTVHALLFRHVALGGGGLHLRFGASSSSNVSLLGQRDILSPLFILLSIQFA